MCAGWKARPSPAPLFLCPEEGKKTEGFVIPLQAPGVLAGLVRDVETGAPIAGAIVHAGPERPGSYDSNEARYST